MRLNKHLYFLYAFFATITMGVTFASCSSEDSDDIVDRETNINANTASTANPHVTRMEFPKLKGGSSIIITHSTNDKYGVNYSVEWDCELKSQRWTCYQMYYDNRIKNVDRKEFLGDPFLEYPDDPKLPEGSYHPYRFSSAGFQHGHIIPSADRLYSREANVQTFYMSNIQPQYRELNTGIWSDMEKQLRDWTPIIKGNADTLYVCKGGTIDNTSQILKYINDNQIVPGYYYMAVLMKNDLGYRALAFWVKHERVDRSDDNLANYVISIDELEAKTGIDFFCNLPDAIENHVEANVALSAWGLRK